MTVQSASVYVSVLLVTDGHFLYLMDRRKNVQFVLYTQENHVR